MIHIIYKYRSQYYVVSTFIFCCYSLQQEGYEAQHNGKCVTIFSAPNYCDQMGNKGAFITLRPPDLKPVFTQFEAVVNFWIEYFC